MCRDRLLIAVLMGVLMGLLGACADSGTTGRSGRDGGNGSDTAVDLIGDVSLEPTDDDFDGDGLPNTLEDLNRNGTYDEGTRETDLFSPDTDGDGLVDGNEDANRNGQVDEGETDPRNVDTDGDGLTDSAEILDHGTDPSRADSDNDGLSDGAELGTAGTDPNNPDSDGDGLLDGDEDRNGNGVVDPTETDPNVQDTDSDGTLDASEPVQIACAESRQAPIRLHEESLGDWMLALPEVIDASGAFDLRGGPGEVLHGGYFQETTGALYGFVIVKTVVPGVARGVDQAETEAAYLNNVGLVSNRRVAPLVSWDGFFAASLELELHFDSAVAASVARDEVAAAIARRTTSELGVVTAPQGPTGTDWVVRLSVTQRTPERSAIVGALAPASTVLSDEALRQRLVQMTDSTPLSQYGDDVAPNCAQVPIEATEFEADFLFLVDRSLSMLEEREEIISLSQNFFDTLSSTLLDYRLAVASTGMHTDDSWILVEPGFSEARDDFVAQMTDPPGGDLEYGLSTGRRIVTLARGGGTSGGTHVRAGAKVIVVFVSDEQDQGIDLQIEQGVPGCDPSADPNLTGCPLLQQHIQAYQDLDVTAFALVGDMPDGCGDEGTATFAPEPGRGYLQVAYATGGGFGSICGDLSAPIDQIIRAAFGAASTYVLDPPPISHTLRVVLDGELLPLSRTNGYDYDPAAESLVFYGDYRPDIGSELIVSYKYFLDQTEVPDPDPIIP